MKIETSKSKQAFHAEGSFEALELTDADLAQVQGSWGGDADDWRFYHDSNDWGGYRQNDWEFRHHHKWFHHNHDDWDRR